MSSVRFPAILIAATGFLIATPAFASGQYVAVPAQAQVARTVISSGLSWRCDSDSCVARRDRRSADRHVCERLAREIGGLTAFKAADLSFDDSALGRCNQRVAVEAPATGN